MGGGGGTSTQQSRTHPPSPARGGGTRGRAQGDCARARVQVVHGGRPRSRPQTLGANWAQSRRELARGQSAGVFLSRKPGGRGSEGAPHKVDGDLLRRHAIVAHVRHGAVQHLVHDAVHHCLVVHRAFGQAMQLHTQVCTRALHSGYTHAAWKRRTMQGRSHNNRDTHGCARKPA